MYSLRPKVMNEMNSNQMRSNYDFTVRSISCSATRIPIGFRRMIGSDQIRSGPLSDFSTHCIYILSIFTRKKWHRCLKIFSLIYWRFFSTKHQLTFLTRALQERKDLCMSRKIHQRGKTWGPGVDVCVLLKHQTHILRLKSDYQRNN
jgi:hypothetical protein